MPSKGGSGRGVSELPPGRLNGHFRSFKGDWGFIRCPDFEGDLFAHRDNLQSAFEPVPGTEVSFSIEADKRGRATAVEIEYIGFEAPEIAAAPEVAEPKADAPRESPAEALVGAGSLPGIIRSWKGKWGFIICPTLFEGDVFCHRDHVHLPMGDYNNEAEVAALLVDQAVEFEVGHDNRGRVIAVNVKLQALGQPDEEAAFLAEAGMDAQIDAEAAQVDNGEQGPGDTTEDWQGDTTGDEVLVGTLRSWKDLWGFIICPEKFEGDIFAHRSNFLGHVPNEALVAGQKVRFQEGVDMKGKRAAKNIELIYDGPPQRQPAPAPRGSALAVMAPAVGARKGAGKAMPAAQDQRAVGPPHGSNGSSFHGASIHGATPALWEQVEPKFAHLVGQWVPGVVRSWKDRWGFLNSDAFEGDLHVHQANLVEMYRPPRAGDAVSFQIGVDNQGRTTAMQVWPAEEANSGQWTSPSAWTAAAPEMPLGVEKDQLVDSGAVVIGKVRSWKDNWGFIVAPAVFEGDIFCHSDALVPGVTPTMVANSDVEFMVGRDKKGRAMARNVRPVAWEQRKRPAA
eukprot:CAMPEP_0117575946 /NCGR_PEP_ID=MMETSP0784-20121206/62509_1 /TAXON_ID=39447 /ORGANISM="" /LENGTH=565 /DNA_ID=CAMNT_0005375113 /DNA_START=1 /DNA_END=1695 /DNA_ORIENTATION=+